MADAAAGHVLRWLVRGRGVEGLGFRVQGALSCEITADKRFQGSVRIVLLHDIRVMGQSRLRSEFLYNTSILLALSAKQ